MAGSKKNGDKQSRPASLRADTEQSNLSPERDAETQEAKESLISFPAVPVAQRFPPRRWRPIPPKRYRSQQRTQQRKETVQENAQRIRQAHDQVLGSLRGLRALHTTGGAEDIAQRLQVTCSDNVCTNLTTVSFTGTQKRSRI